MQKPLLLVACAALTLSFTLASAADGTQHSLSGGTLARVQSTLSKLGISSIVRIEALEKRDDTIHFSYVPVQDAAYQDQIEQLFREKNGQDLWIKILMVIADATREPIGMIDGTGPGTMGCRTSHVSLRYKLSYNRPRSESGCMAGVFGLDVRLPVEQKILASAERTESTQLPDINLVKGTIENFLAQSGADVSVGDISVSHICLTADGAKRLVLRDGNAWEKINLLVVFHPIRNQDYEIVAYSVVASADGYLASGIGGPPPRSGYVKSMEPRYISELETFATSVVLKIADILKG